MTDDEKPTPERAVRLLRAKGAELENPMPTVSNEVRWLAADIALIAQLLADHIERSNASQVLYEAHVENLIERVYVLEGGDSGPSILEVDPHARDHIIELRPRKWVIQHPLSERLDGSLFDCSVEWGREDVGVYGRFVLVWDEEADEWVLGEKLLDVKIPGGPDHPDYDEMGQ